MRHLQVRVEGADLDAVLDVLRREDIDPVVLPTHDVISDIDDTTAVDTDDHTYLVTFPLPTEAVDRVRDALSETGLEEEHLVIGNAESAKTPNYETLVERFIESGEETERVSNEEIQTKAHGLNPQPVTYYTMTILSVLVATSGLVLDSPALVVGSMVIAPQIGAALTGSVGVVLGDETMFTDGLWSTVFGLGVAIVAAALLGWGLKTAQFVPSALDVATVQQIASRTSPGLLTLLVALCAGAAGGVGLATELPVSIVGVAVAAATVPAAAAVGIGLAWGIPTVTVGALALLAVNVAGIILSGALSLWFLGYRPSYWDSASSTSGHLRTLLTSRTTWLAIVVLGLTVLGPGALVASHIVFENQTTTAVQTVLEDPTYDSLGLVSVRVDFETAGVSDAPREVTVAVQVPVDQRYPQLATRLRSEIRAVTGEDVAVNVELEERSRSEPPA